MSSFRAAVGCTVATGLLMHAPQPAKQAPPTQPSSTRPAIPADGRSTVGRAELQSKSLEIQAATRKAHHLVATHADHAGKASFLPHVTELVEYCYQLEEEYDEPGFGATWYQALVYGFANFNLKCYAIAHYEDSADCTGPFDVKQQNPHVLDPIDNMKHHVDEQFLGWQKGYRGLGLCRYVFLPSSPRDWGGGQFAKTDRLFRQSLQQAYQRGDL